jgi:hypothetical protein
MVDDYFGGLDPRVLGSRFLSLQLDFMMERRLCDLRYACLVLRHGATLLCTNATEPLFHFNLSRSAVSFSAIST